MDEHNFKENKIQINEILKKIFIDIINHNNNTSYKTLSYESRTNKNKYCSYHNLIKDNIQNSNKIT